VKASVLVVDDDSALRRFLSDRLRFLGHHVETVADGEAALAAAERHRFDLVLLDLNMPGLSGFDVIDRLRARPGDEQIVVLTAHGSVERVVDAMKRGADDFLTKPADLSLLEKILDRALEKRRLQRVGRASAERRDGLVLGPSKAMTDLVEIVDRVARSDVTVLLNGESGTGKQVFAEALHARSPRARGPFV
jgi:two-component system nitrogen regulation response regulator GlnG